MGGGKPCRHPFVARMSQARRKHVAGMRRGTCPSAGGGGMPCGSRRRPFYPALAPLVVPPLKVARRMLSTGTVVWSVPNPLAANSPPCRFVLGGGALFAPPYLHLPPLGGRRCGAGGGGAPLSSSLRSGHVAGTTQAWRRHEARHLSLCRGGRLAVCHPLSPLLPCVRTPGGAEVCGGGGGGAPLSSSLRCTHVAGTTQSWFQDAHCAGHDAWQLSPTLPPLLPPSPSVLAWC